MAFPLVARKKAAYPVRTVSRVLGMSHGGFYARCIRPPSRRPEASRRLLEQVRQIHPASHGVNGAPRAHAELREESLMRCGRQRVERLMR